MASKNLFSSFFSSLSSRRSMPVANTVNDAGAKAYAFTSEHALAQYAATGSFNQTFYATEEEQLAKTLELCLQVSDEFLAKLAVFARHRGARKDMPAFLLAVLSTRNTHLLSKVFPLVVDNGKMLRNFVQILRSGAVGRKSLGTRPKKLVWQWLESQSEEALFKATVGNDPSIADVLRMVHAKPSSPAREALYGYILGRKHDATLLPQLVQRFEEFKVTRVGEVPNVPFQMLTSLDLSKEQWAQVAKNASLQTLRMNLNTFERHGVFEIKGLDTLIAEKLRNAEAIRRSKTLPYQWLVAYQSVGIKVPAIVRDALQDAMEISIENVPKFSGKIFVLVDVSGSMSSPITGYRKGSTTAVRCIDVVGLIAASFLRKNEANRIEIIPFAEHVKRVHLNARDSVMTNATALARLGGGGTNCSAPLEHLNERNERGDLIIFVSDNESWMDKQSGKGTWTMMQWEKFRARNRKAKLVCIDLQPNASTQADEREDVLNIGGFSDQIFETIQAFAEGSENKDRWVDVINRIDLNATA